jgi:hypothetical protein
MQARDGLSLKVDPAAMSDDVAGLNTMNHLEALKQYFQTGTAEGESQLLNKIFVYDAEFVKASAPPYGSPRLLVGRKGAGKTALVKFLKGHLEEQGVPVVLMSPDDFDTSRLGDTAELGHIKRVAFAFLAYALANRFSAAGTLAKGHARTLNSAARAYDAGNIDGVQRLLTILAPVGKAVTDIDFMAMIPDAAPKPEAIAAAIRTELGQTDKVAYLIVDDTDQIGAPNERNYLARLWGLLLGARRLASDCPNLKCIITLRTEVWRRLCWDERGQRDQVDHFLPLVVEWVPGDEKLRAIWRRRLSLAGGPPEAPERLFFAEREVYLPGSSEHRLWADFLVKNARERPRDLVQLMGKLIDKAISQKSTQIRTEHMHAVIGAYSKERADYTADEFIYDCGSLKDVIRSLSRLENVSSTVDVLKHLETLPSAFRIDLRGKTLQAEERQDALLLWRVLHEAGILNALVPDRRETRGFRHINYADDPNLVSAARWNDMQGAQWEIHPAYRSFLNELRDEDAARLGLSANDLRNARRPRG